MRNLLLIFILFVTTFLLLSSPVASSDNIYRARVLEVEETVEQEGVSFQPVTVEILEGEYKGKVEEINISFESIFIRPLRKGDEVKLASTQIGNETYFQFYDFSRSKNYIWLFVLFLIFLLATIGFKGLKTFLPSIFLTLLVLFGFIPDFLAKWELILTSFLTIVTMSLVTGWIRLRKKLPLVVVALSVVICLFVGFLTFLGFAHVSYVVPFIGSLPSVDKNLYLKVLDLVFISVLFIPAGGVINASIQVTKYLLEEVVDDKKLSIKQMLKEGLRISQKISAGELNNLIIMLIGTSIAGIYLVKVQYEQISIWDNGWVALQVIYALSSGLSILLISPITVIIYSAVLGVSKSRLSPKRKHKNIK